MESDILVRGSKQAKPGTSSAWRAYLWALATIAAIFVLSEVVAFERLVGRLVPGSLCVTHAVAIIDARAREAALARQAPQPKIPAAPSSNVTEAK